MISRPFILAIALLLSANLRALDIGTARLDITPTEPIRLNGYGSRDKPSAGIAQRLFAKALAIGREDPSIIITADLIGVSQSITDQVRSRLQASHEISPNRVAICVTHTHTGPSIHGILEDIFMAEIPADQRLVISNHTRELTDRLYRVAVAALESRQPGELAWGLGKADFAINRRVLENGRWKGFGENPDGPVDHSLPVMRATNTKGELIALFLNYACHCTTLGGDFNRIHGDWAGRASELIEAEHPGANALIAIGCGADANPKNRGSFAAIEPHARQILDEVRRLLGTDLKPLGQITTARFADIDLPFDPLPTKADWQKRIDEKNRYSFYARKMLAHMESGAELKQQLHYQIQTWQFGEDLAMVFLPGEVVVDYSLRLKEIFRADRLWLNAYANAAPCYLPSRRLYDEGGYEVDRNMWYYGHPTRLSKDTEELIVDEVIRQLPHPFYSPATLRRMPAPVEKSAALETIRTRPDLRVDLVAAEPLVMDPVDIAWGPDGRLWVVEMADYPSGLDDRGRAGGRIRFLEDTDQDGIYDRSTLFADGLNFPSSVMPWRDGILVTAAPDILFIRDTDQDNRADQFTKLLTGFGEGNQQHRINSLQWGLDNRVHCANGDSDGEILSHRSGQRLNIRGRDFAFDPDTGELFTESGRTQHSRCRDDAGNWFGVNNSWPGWHVALEDRYLGRNPHISWPDVRSHLQTPPTAGPVHPASRTLNRLNDFSRVNRFTSACGSTIYRDNTLGDDYRGNYFVCEPVHNLVRREIVTPHGTTFRSSKPADEAGMEFFASTDNWSRPVAVRTGPDGALHVVDMYRFLIEHPQWVPADWQRKLEFRDGSDKGRIYRLTPKNSSSRRIVPNLATCARNRLIETLASPNGPLRDLAHQQLLWRKDPGTARLLRELVTNSESHHARLHALCILEGLDELDLPTLVHALDDPAPEVLRHAVRLSETLQDRVVPIGDSYSRLAGNADTDPQVRKQLAYSLGYSTNHSAVESLLKLAFSDSADEFLISATLSSARRHITHIADSISDRSGPSQMTDSFFKGLVRTAAGDPTGRPALHRLATLATASPARLVQFLDGSAGTRLDPETRNLFTPLFTTATRRAFDPKTSAHEKTRALELLRHAPADQVPSLDKLQPLLLATSSPELQRSTAETALALHGEKALRAAFDKWTVMGTGAREETLRKILRRQDWTLIALDWLASNHPAIATLPTEIRIALTTHSKPGIRKRASELFGATIQSDRQTVVDAYAKAITTTGSAVKGGSLFATACAVCHVGRDGRPALGPDLAALSDYSPSALLVAILDPNRAVEDKFLAHTAVTRNDEELTGVLIAESAGEIQLADAGGQVHSIPRHDLVSLAGSGASLMPEGFESAIPPSSMSDLIAHLRGLASPRAVHANADGVFNLFPTHARLVSDGSASVTPDAIIAVAARDKIEWTLGPISAGDYEIVADSAVVSDYVGKPFHLTVGGIVADGIFERTGSLTRFRSRKFGNIRIPSKLETTSVVLTHDLPGPILALRSIALIPLR